MVRVEPFIYQKVTAFRERIQMVDKINEMIDVLNDGIDPEEVRAIITEELSNYYDKAEIDDMFENIDFSPYYTKTEVDTIVTRIDGDVDAVEGRMNTAEGDINALEGRMGTAEGDIDNLEGRMNTAEGDIDALETNKQNNLTVGQGLSLANNEIDLSGWEVVPLAEWSSLFDVVDNSWLKAKEELVMQYVVGGTEDCIFFPKGMRIESIYLHTNTAGIRTTEFNISWYYIMSVLNIIDTSSNYVTLNSRTFSINQPSGIYECRIMVEGDTSEGRLTKVETDGRMTPGNKFRFFRRV